MSDNELTAEAIDMVSRMADIMVGGSAVFDPDDKSKEGVERWTFFEEHYRPMLFESLAWLEVVNGE